MDRRSNFPVTRYFGFRRTPSSEESIRFLDDDSLMSRPAAAAPLKFLGVPFSWEKIPGIPKKVQNDPDKMKKESVDLLPLPLPPKIKPLGEKQNTKKKDYFSLEDPFMAALVECSKKDEEEDDDENEDRSISKGLTRSISDRFGFVNLYGSCKRRSSVSKSTVCRPRSTLYDHLINRPSR